MHLRSHIFFKRQHPNNSFILGTDLLQTGKNLRSTAPKIVESTNDNSISYLTFFISHVIYTKLFHNKDFSVILLRQLR